MFSSHAARNDAMVGADHSSKGGNNASQSSGSKMSKNCETIERLYDLETLQINSVMQSKQFYEQRSRQNFVGGGNAKSPLRSMR